VKPLPKSNDNQEIGEDSDKSFENSDITYCD